MARTDPQFNLRVPAELKQQVEEAAKLSGRSINAEAVYRLEQSFKNINNYGSFSAFRSRFFCQAFPNAKKSSTQVGLRKILCLKVEKL